ncbi:hypothetical protein ATANTOWER_007141, partial [Ataeniobius toweri]|nr:hypothetical protein [Ataeniobius toweri]
GTQQTGNWCSGQCNFLVYVQNELSLKITLSTTVTHCDGIIMICGWVSSPMAGKLLRLHGKKDGSKLEAVRKAVRSCRYLQTGVEVHLPGGQRPQTYSQSGNIIILD